MYVIHACMNVWMDGRTVRWMDGTPWTYLSHTYVCVSVYKDLYIRFWLWGSREWFLNRGCLSDACDMKDCARIIRVRPMVSHLK